MSNDYARVSEAVVELAGSLIDDHYKHLSVAKIVYLFQEKATISKGKVVMGKAVKPNKRENFLHGWDFELILAEDIWSVLNDAQRLYILNYELRHCVLNDKDAWVIYSHDFADFRDVLERNRDAALSLDSILEGYLKERESGE